MARKSDEKKSFKLYNDYGKQFEKLDDASAGQLIKAVFAYVNNEPLPQIDDCGADMAFSFIAAQLDRDKIAYDEKCETNRRNGGLGGRPSKTKNQTVSEKPNAFNENRSVSNEPQNQEPIEAKKEENPQEKPKEAPTEKAKNIQEERFDLFWKAYPKKVGKKTAKNAWNKIKPDADLFQEIMAALEIAKTSRDWQKQNGQFVPYPATWLNRDGWYDELPGTPVQMQSGYQEDPNSNPFAGQQSQEIMNGY